MIHESGVEVANAIRLRRQQYNGAFLLVEGPNDFRFFQKFIDFQTSDIVVGHSKGNVLSALEILDQAHIGGVLAITDSDEELLGIPSRYASANLAQPDGRDLDAQLVFSPAFSTL